MHFEPALTYYIQVKLAHSSEARLLAQPVEGHGSGDFANLLHADAFLELPAERNTFFEGEVLRIFPFKNA